MAQGYMSVVIMMRENNGDEEGEEDVWDDCSDFLPHNFDEILEWMRSDSTARFRRLGVIP